MFVYCGRGCNPIYLLLGRLNLGTGTPSRAEATRPLSSISPPLGTLIELSPATGREGGGSVFANSAIHQMPNEKKIRGNTKYVRLLLVLVYQLTSSTPPFPSLLETKMNFPVSLSPFFLSREQMLN